MKKVFKKKSIYLSDELHYQLKSEALKLRVKLQELIEEIILEHYGTTKPPKVSTKETN